MDRQQIKWMIFDYMYGHDNMNSVDEEEQIQFEDYFEKWWENYSKSSLDILMLNNTTYKLDTTERVCPECNGNLKHIVNRLDETDWLCDNCNTRFTVPNLKDWSRIYISGEKSNE